MGIIFHSGCTVELYGIEDICSSLFLLATEELKPGLGHLPHDGTIGLTLFNHHLTELLHLPRLLLVDVAHEHLTIGITIATVIDIFLSIVHEVGEQPRQCLRGGVLLVVLTDGLIRTLQIVDGHEALIVVHLSEELSGLSLTARLVKGACIDVIHHLLIDRLDILAGCLLPEGDVLLMLAEHHVTTHKEQAVLRTKLRVKLALSVCADGLQVALLGSNLLLRGIAPLVLLILFHTDALEILLQVLHIADHQGITLLTGSFQHIVIMETPPLIFAGVANIGFPVVVADLLYTAFEALPVIGAEQIVIVCAPSATGECRHNQCRQQANDDKSLHRFLVYICQYYLCRDDR